MADEKIDGNHRNEWGLYNETTGLIESARVDPIFDYLEVYNVGAATGTFTTLDHAKIDGNGRNTITAYNETTGGIEALRTDLSGNLIIKIV